MGRMTLNNLPGLSARDARGPNLLAVSYFCSESSPCSCLWSLVAKKVLNVGWDHQKETWQRDSRLLFASYPDGGHESVQWSGKGPECLIVQLNMSRLSATSGGDQQRNVCSEDSRIELTKPVLEAAHLKTTTNSILACHRRPIAPSRKTSSMKQKQQQLWAWPYSVVWHGVDR